MMKWGAFATGELSEAQKKFMEEENSDDYNTEEKNIPLKCYNNVKNK